MVATVYERPSSVPTKERVCAFFWNNKNWRCQTVFICKSFLWVTVNSNTYLQFSVALKYTSSGASIQFITCFRPDPVRVMWGIFGFPLICGMWRGRAWLVISETGIIVVYWSGVDLFISPVGSLVNLFGGGPVIIEPGHDSSDLEISSFQKFKYISSKLMNRMYERVIPTYHHPNPNPNRSQFSKNIKLKLYSD